MVIPAGQTVMLDVDTPVLKMLLIQGMQAKTVSCLIYISPFSSYKKCCDLICLKLWIILGRHCFYLLEVIINLY